MIIYMKIFVLNNSLEHELSQCNSFNSLKKYFILKSSVFYFFTNDPLCPRVRGKAGQFDSRHKDDRINDLISVLCFQQEKVMRDNVLST